MNIHTLLNASLGSGIFWAVVAAILLVAFTFMDEGSRTHRIATKVFGASIFNAIFAVLVHFVALIYFHFNY